MNLYKRNRGWRNESIRHSRARLYGHAGGLYHKTMPSMRMSAIKIPNRFSIPNTSNLSIKVSHRIGDARVPYHYYLPYSGRVERNILRLLFNYTHRPCSTREIASALRDNIDSVRGSLNALYDRNPPIVRKAKRGNVCYWLLNPDRLAIREAEDIAGIRQKREDRGDRYENAHETVEAIETISKPLLEAGLQTLALTMPVAREVYVTYKIADAIYSKAALLNRCIDTYQNDGMTGVSKVLVKEGLHTIASTALSDYQSQIIWSCVEDRIPSDVAGMAKVAVDKVVDGITEAEISYVERSL